MTATRAGISLRRALDAIPMVMIRQKWDQPQVSAVGHEVEEQLARAGALDRIRPGNDIAITAGSRGIRAMPQVLLSIVKCVRARGAQPFIFPAMGSHGGGTSEGQRDLLAGLGITEASIGCPIRSTMDVVQIGETGTGLPVFVDALALGADGIIITNRIKKHTNFDAPIESGLCKMAVIGMGKHAQALAVHQRGNETLCHELAEIAQIVLNRAPVLVGLALLENAWGGLARVVALRPDQIVAKEPALLTRAMGLSPKIPFRRLDIGIVERIGKEISGTGMDCYVIGRRRIVGEPEWSEAPHINSLVALDLTEASHGNALGVGLADFVTDRLVSKIDWDVTRANVMTSGNLERAKLPLVFGDDRAAIEAAGFRERATKDDELRLVCMPDTLHLQFLYVSVVLAHGPGLGEAWDIEGPPGHFRFDAKSNWLSPFDVCPG